MIVDALGYVFGFWLFVFNRRFRERTREHWRAMSPSWAKLVIPIEASISAVFGIGVPLIAAYVLLAGR